MSVYVSYPGVYIQEFTPGAPIAGVGTSTAAFIGPATSGPLNVPTLVTSWDQFKTTFGGPIPGFYLWYAVWGFFQNGGTTCFVTRLSNATFATVTLADQSGGAGQPTIVLTARTPGAPAQAISATVVGNVHAVDKATAKLYRPTATIQNAAGSTVTVTSAADAATFRAGDAITWTGSTEAQPSTVVTVSGSDIRVSTPLTSVYAAGTVHLADLVAGATILRVASGPGLAAGSVLELVQGASPAVTVAVDTVQTEKISPALTTWRITLRSGLPAAISLAPGAADTTVESEEFRITPAVTGAPAIPAYDDLSMDPAHPRYFVKVINADANGVLNAAPVFPPNTTGAPANRPRDIANVALAGGTNDNPATLTASDYTDSLDLLLPIKDINLVAIPDRQDAQVQHAVIAHCSTLKSRFAILDSQLGAPLFGTGSVEVQRAGLSNDDGYAALYYPWLVVPAAVGNGTVLVPPSGHVAGIYARTDNSRGVHKAPAGEDAIANGAISVERTMSDTDQGLLNLAGIDAIRVFTAGAQPVVWGARTTSDNTNWQYVNIRRLFIYLEQSIEVGIRWAVFEPNNTGLWEKLKRTISEFLTRVWKDGALFGEKATDAFYVRIDDVLNPFSEQQLGRLNIEIGLRPSYPAEFIIVRIGIWPGGSDITGG